MSDPDDAGPGSDLCLSCGLCCNSGLFTHVELTADDRDQLAQHGLPAPERIEQPCGFWNASCSIYAVRPAKCREYRCELLKGVETGAIGAPEAQERIGTALAMRAMFANILADNHELRNSARTLREIPGSDRSPAMMKAVLDYVAYRMFVERHFLGPEQRWVTKPATPDVSAA